ncbi:hypothetical protein Sfulv_58960 [Streptomyces fulvorobeus]|uniref:Uncharacterized protein n=1 Tax=Streptomyces fulvorobeus TaxID=284028 RepID=A0A7J0CF40_9ACTN|nr:hypothetical protein Sfulv_58960 [Streptomyces fulvorobeus]
MEGAVPVPAGPRARGGLPLGDRRSSQAGHQGCGARARSRRGPPWFRDGPAPPFRQINRTTDYYHWKYGAFGTYPLCVLLEAFRALLSDSWARSGCGIHHPRWPNVSDGLGHGESGG